MAAKLKLNINGKEVTGYAGQTIFEVAKENGIDIPTLCHDGRVEPFGSCGLCVVEAEGMPKLLRACSSQISNGMVIHTNSKRVLDSRRAILELMLADHTGDCRPPCAVACPAHTDCQAYVGMVANGQEKEAAKIIKSIFPFPASIGRVCPHPCEAECRRGLVEEPISIAYIKAYIGDQDLESGHPYMLPVSPDTGKKVCVIGGGPAGLTAAYHLRASGHDVTVIDAMPKMGGMLKYGIPEYRLPKNVLEKEIDLIEGMGVKMINGVKIGRDVSFESIVKKYDAVLVAIGAWLSSGMRIPGEDGEGVIGGIDFLRKVALGEEVHVGNTIAVTGGGNVAMDAVRTSVRLGAKKVYCIYRRTREEMPAEDLEIAEAMEEGVEFKFLTNPIEVVHGADGKIECVRCQKMELGEPDESGRRRPVPIEGAIEDIKVDSLIMSIGQKVDAGGLTGIELTKKGTIVANESTFRTNIENVFAVGDATNKGPGIAIAAIGEAVSAAKVMDSYLAGEIIPHKDPYLVKSVKTAEDLADKPKAARVAMPVRTPEERKDNFGSVIKGFSKEQAVEEAKRCLECGCHDYYECKLIARANQSDVHPEKYEGGEKHHRTLDNSHPYIEFTPDKCVLCGLCVRVCDEVMGRTALGYIDRGFDEIIAPCLKRPLSETDCISCGQCVSICPTGALGEKVQYGKRVPTKGLVKTESVCSFCSVGCPVVYETAENMIMKAVPADGKLLCVNGKFKFAEAEREGRLTKPLIRIDGELREASWRDALLYVAKKMQGVYAREGSGAVAVSVSGKLTNEEIALAKKYAEGSLHAGTFTSLEYKATGADAVLGKNAPKYSIEEIKESDAILLVGTNLMEEHACYGVRVRQAKKNGAKIITINDLPDSQEAQEADLYIKASDEKALKGIIKALMDAGKTTKGLEAGLDGIEAGEEEKKAAEILLAAKRPTVVTDAVDTAYEMSKAAAEIAMLLGGIGKARSGIHEIRQYCNSQGLADAGIAPVCCSSGLKDGSVKALLSIGEEPEGGRGDLEFFAVGSLYLTDAAKTADAVLPIVPLMESEGTVTSMDGTVKSVTPVVEPKSLTNTEVIEGLIKAAANTL